MFDLSSYIAHPAIGPFKAIWRLGTSHLYDNVKGMPKISSKHQVTLPVAALQRAGLKEGDEVAIEAEGEDRIVVRRSERDVTSALGVFDGLYEPDYLERLRSGERA